MELSPEQLQEAQFLAQAMKMVATKNDPSAQSVLNGGLDSGGAFSYPHTGPDIISAMVQPKSFIDKLVLKPSKIVNEVQGVLTGQQDETGTNPETSCGDPVRPGALKTCDILTRWGKMYVGSNKIKLDEIGLRDSYALAGEKRIINGQTAFANTWVVPDALRVPNVNVASPGSMALFSLANAIRRVVARVEVIGDNSLAYNATAKGWIKEFDSLDRLIAPVNDVTGVACPAASPFKIETWDAAINATVNGRSIMNLMIQMWRGSRMIAEDTDVATLYGDPMMTWVMDKNLFYGLVDFWACNYQTYNCTGTDGSPINRDAMSLERRLIEMRNGKFLWIDGERTPVEFTSGADTDQTTSTWNGSIYLTSMNPNLTYLEYNPFNDVLTQQAIADFGSADQVAVMNGGLYMLFKNQRNACVEVNATAWLRLIMKARFLSARIDGVEFTPQIGFRDWNPEGSSWFDGGRTVYTNYFPPAA